MGTGNGRSGKPRFERRSYVIGPLWPRPKEEWAMQTEKTASKKGYSAIGRLLRVLGASACLWPSVAAAQPPNPTKSDIHGNTAAGSAALLSVTSGYNNTAIGID